MNYATLNMNDVLCCHPIFSEREHVNIVIMMNWNIFRILMNDRNMDEEVL